MTEAMNKRLDLDGIFIPVPTPFENNANQAVNYQMLRENIRKWEKIPFKGYCIGGSYGEGPCLKPEEKLAMVRAVKSEISKNKIVMVGTSCEATNETCELSIAAAEAGADLVLIYPPPYYKKRLTDANIIDHYIKIADTIPIPILIYNATSSIGIDLSLDVIKALAVHPNICAIKETDAAKMASILQATQGSSFDVIADSSARLLPALQMGCIGGFMGIAGILGNELCKLHSLVRNDQWSEAIELQKRITTVDYLIATNYGPPGLKAAMDMMGLYGGMCRRPLQEVDENARQKIKEALELSDFYKNSEP